MRPRIPILCGTNALAAVILAMVLCAGQATAQLTPPQQRAVLVDIEEEADPLGNNLHGGGQFELTPETLDQWVFNGSPEMARQNYQTLIKLEIAQIDTAVTLSTEQKRMLQLAGAGELQHIRESLAVLHARYAGRIYEQDKMGEIFQEIQPYRNQVQRQPLDSTSLLFKLLPTILDTVQHERFTAWTQQRDRSRLRGQIDVAVAEVEKRVPLRASQREALIQLLEAEVVAVTPDGEGMAMAVQQGSSVLAQMHAIDPKAFRAFLDDAQWEATQAVFLPHRGRLRMGGMM